MDKVFKSHLPEQRVSWNDAIVRKYDVAGPRYTSYPTAPQFDDTFGPEEYARYLRERPATIAPLSLYVHVPFCTNICYYCACNKIITRDKEVAERYLVALEQEMALLAPHFDRRRRVMQLHWGGGTPTFLSNAEMTRLMHQLACHFSLNNSPAREYSIEIDPRGTNSETFALLKGLGFNRISMGIQDFDPEVQKAINRIQPYSMVEPQVASVRELGFKSLSFDLIYGLPRQDEHSIRSTLQQVLSLSPDRISCYSYAHLPDIFKTQRSIDRMEVPSAEARLRILHAIIETLCAAGYLYIGMDHFVKPEDDLGHALHAGTLQRNFQGYSTQHATDLIGIGVSAISSTDNLYCQNVRSLEDYYALLEQNRLPVQRGLQLGADDLLRRDVIMQIICRMELDIDDIEKRYGIGFRSYFATELQRLAEMEREGLLQSEGNRLLVTATGRLLVRNICMVFDAYLDPEKQRFSRTI